MKKILFLILLLLGTGGEVLASGEITVVVGDDSTPYQEALTAFYLGCIERDPTLGLKGVSADSLTEFRLTDPDSRSSLQRHIVRRSPRVLVATGIEAMQALESVTSVPIVYLMVPAPETFIHNRTNLTGVSMRLAPAQQLEAFFKAAPSIKRLGLIYDPTWNADTVKQIERYCASHNIDLVAAPARESRQIPSLLAAMRAQIDVYWMLPDPTVTTPQTLEYILSFSVAERIPVIAFAEKFLEFGAAVSVGLDDVAAGRQASELVLRIMAAAANVPLPEPMTGRPKVVVNRKIAEKLGLAIKASQNHPPDPAGDGETAAADNRPLL